MYEIDNAQFGSFVAQLRREKGYTQKQLAQRLCISDKAVSKWERGLSLPDISMLLPLAEALEVSVTELLESRRIDVAESTDMEQVEEIVKKAISFSGERPAERGGASRRAKLGFVVSSCLSLAIIAYLYFSGGPESFLPGTMTMVGLCFLFGVYFTFLAKDRLPDYYDDNHISSYSDGIFRFNLVGVRFNNRNWPHILNALRRWCSWTQLAVMTLLLILRSFFPDFDSGPYRTAILVLFLAALFIPVYITAKKYE